MRRLKTSDVFAFCRICSEAHVRDEVKAIAAVVQKEGAEADATAVGYDLILSVVEHLGAKGAEHMIYEFFAGVWEMDPDDIANMELSELSDTIKRWGSEYVDKETLKAFFGSLSRLMR